MIWKIALNSVIKGIPSWVSLIITSVAVCVVLTLNIALVIVGVETEGEAQQAYVAMGGVALGFSIITGLASFTLVVGICVRLQRRAVALWQIVGVLPRTAFSIMMIEILLVSAVSAAIGAAVSVLVWPAYADFIGESGLPYSEVLDEAVPGTALIIGIATTAAVSIVAGLRSSRKIVNGSLIDGVKSSSAFVGKPASTLVRIITTLVGIALLAGVGAIYVAIGSGPPIVDPQAMGDFLTVYPGMGLLLCLVFVVLGGSIVGVLIRILTLMPGGIAQFLASREASARPRLTQALIIPISLAAAAVGVMVSWVEKLEDILSIESGQENTVSAPPGQMALLLGGPVIVACIAAAAIVFATVQNRQEDNALLLISGSTPATVYAKAIIEAAIYAVVSLVCAYLIIGVNEIAIVTALSSGPIPTAELAFPGWTSAGVVMFGVFLTLIMLLVITASGTRKQSLSIVLRGN